MNSYKHTILMACIIALVCAALVWYLERFQMDAMIGKWQDYLRKHDALDEWERDHGGD